MLSAAGRLRWFRDTLAPDTPFDELVASAAAVPAGSDGLLFLPYLTGERTPHPDPLARGAFIGLTVRHTRAHMVRAVLEGVAYGLRDSFELMKASGLANVTEVRVSGGGTKSKLWQQILADVIGVELVTLNTAEGAAYGAAVLAAAGTGTVPSVSAACQQWIKTVDRIVPSDNAAIYEQRYPQFSALYPLLQPTFQSMAA